MTTYQNLFRSILFSIFIISLSAFGKFNLNLENNRADGIVIQFSLQDYQIKSQFIHNKEHSIIAIENAAYFEEKGFPDLPIISRNIIIPDYGKMAVEIVDAVFHELSINSIIPSKGAITRNIDPAGIPYIFGDIYKENRWYPERCAFIGKTFILRDFRGSTILFKPVQYNPFLKKVRIYSSIKVKIYPTKGAGENVLKRRRSPLKISQESHRSYNRRFLNYTSHLNQIKYDPVEEDGSMLVISHSSYLDLLQPFIDWKNRSGIKTTLIDVSVTGGNTNGIKDYIKNLYDSTDLKYILLVGDEKQIPSIISPAGRQVSDNLYCCLKGNDNYVDAFIGRLVGANISEIETQINKLLHYERKLTPNDSWIMGAMATGTSKEPDDVAATNEKEADFKGYGYDPVTKYLDKSDNANVVNDINRGLSVHINSSHANVTSTNNLSTSDIPKMTNKGKYPFNFTLGCNPGEFDNSRECLGEALLKKKDGGFIGAFMASLSQPWDPPYYGISEHCDLVTEQYTDNIKWTYGGIAHNGCHFMLEKGNSTNQYVKTSDCWVLFGDPSMMIYTKTPTEISIKHPDVVNGGEQEVEISGTDSATVCLYSKKLKIQSVGLIKNGSVSIKIKVPDDANEDTIYVTGTKPNHTVYEGSMIVITGPYINVAKPASGDVLWAKDKTTITWNTGGGANVKEVKIEYSVDKGSTYKSVTDKTDNDGSHDWTIPDINESDKCIIKIKDLNGNLEDKSGIFTIKQKATISLSQKEFKVELKPNMSIDRKLKITNAGKGKLTFSLSISGGVKVLTNEIYISDNSFFDGFELWNQGPDLDMSGWKVKWNDNRNTSGQYSFPSGFIFKGGKTLVMTDDQAGTNDSTIYCGINLAWGFEQTELSIAILDKDGRGVDFLKSSGNNDTPPAGTQWNGGGIDLTNDYVHRTRNEDNDDATDWTSSASGTVNLLNTGQTPSSGHWLSISPKEGIVDPQSSKELKVTFNAANLADGIYFDTITLVHNDPDNQSPIRIPCKFKVDPSVDILNNNFVPSSFGLRIQGSRLHFTVPENGQNNTVNITIYNIQGKQVKALMNDRVKAGYHSLPIGRLAAGLYLCKMETKGFIKKINFLLIR